MFDKIGNLPLHPLVVHAAVVGIPLAALLAFLFAFPKTRQWARWPLGIVVVGATAVTYVARESGLALEAASGDQAGKPGWRFDLEALLACQPVVLHHDRLFRCRPAQCVPVSRRASVEGEGGTEQPAIVRIVLPILLLAVAVVALVWVVRVGDLGAHAVWNPTAPPMIPF